MLRGKFRSVGLLGAVALLGTLLGNSSPLLAAPLDQLLAKDNAGKKIAATAVVNDLAFLRRVYVDMVGRIPTEDEIQEFNAVPAADRRAQVVDRLLAEPRFADRWTVFFSDLFRIRSQQPGGDTLIAYVHKAIADGMPYDAMCRQLIAANGKAGKVPEVGFILGDEADPMALAGVTAQVFMGIRVSCAQCHDHPFDKWTREQFYGLAAYFGKTRRIESYLTKAVYTTEDDASVVLWPPLEKANGQARKPVTPKFPFLIDADDTSSKAVARLVSLRTAQEAKRQEANKPKGPTLDELLAEAGRKADTQGKQADAVADEASRDARNLHVERDLYRESQLRKQLAEMVTNPRNRYFSRSLVNRLWAELVGRGFVEPVDDFNDKNPPSHPETLDYLADEFVASGYDLRTPIRLILTSDAYQRGHSAETDLAKRQEAEEAFAAAPVRRMISEAMYDSLVLAGHLFEHKHPAGENNKVVTTIVREAAKGAGKPGLALIKPLGKQADDKQMAMAGKAQVVASGYDLESAIELNFDEVLSQAKGAPEMEAMERVSSEQLEAEMMEERANYVEREVKTTVDDNPQFSSALRMASPAPSTHFLRIFGQTPRDALGEFRQHDASMRQALMMLNGRLTHEASRVGKLEPMYPLLVGKKADLGKAVRLAYREILTREPAKDELAEAKQILSEAPTPIEGMADLRWALFNCHEFRYLP